MHSKLSSPLNLVLLFVFFNLAVWVPAQTNVPTSNSSSASLTSAQPTTTATLVVPSTATPTPDTSTLGATRVLVQGLERPFGLVLDDDGRLVSTSQGDGGQGIIKRISTDGQVTEQAVYGKRQDKPTEYVIAFPGTIERWGNDGFLTLNYTSGALYVTPASLKTVYAQSFFDRSGIYNSEGEAVIAHALAVDPQNKSAYVAGMENKGLFSSDNGLVIFKVDEKAGPAFEIVTEESEFFKSKDPGPFVTSMAAREDELYLAISDEGLYKLSKDKKLTEFGPAFLRTQEILGLTFDPSGVLYAAANEKGQGKIYRIPEDGSTASVVAEGLARPAGMVLQGDRLYVADYTGGVIYEIANTLASALTVPTGQPTRTPTQAPTNIPAATPTLAPTVTPTSGAEDKAVACQNGSAHFDEVLAIAISPDGQLLVSGSTDKTIKLWSLPEGILLKTLEADIFVSAIAISPDGKFFASEGADETITLWSLPEGTLLKTLDADITVDAIAISPDGKLLASSGLDFVTATIKLWSLPEGTLLKTLEGELSDSALSFSPDSELLATGGGRENTIKLWSPLEGDLFKTLKEHPQVGQVIFSPDGKLLVSESALGTIKIWSLPEGTLLKALEADMHVWAIAISPDGKLLAASGFGEDKIRLWSLPEGIPYKTWSNHPSSRTIAFTPDGKSLVSANFDQILIWSVPEGVLDSCLIDTPVRPETGLVLQSRLPPGRGELTVENGTDRDGVVILTQLDDKPVMAAFIRASDSFTFTDIPDDTYRLFFSKGEWWNADKAEFMKNVTRQRFEDTLLFSTSGLTYTTWRVTLYGLVGGAAQTEEVAPAEFPPIK